MNNDKTNCYKCKFKQNVPGDCHISCSNPDPSMTGDPHGIKNGWFVYPYNFDPAWKTKDCSNFVDKDDKSFYCIRSSHLERELTFVVSTYVGTVERLEGEDEKIIESKKFKIEVSTLNIEGKTEVHYKVIEGDLTPSELDAFKKG